MDIAIVGAGFSGLLTAAHLAAAPSFCGTIYVFEQRAETGRGIAYSTPCAAHILNVAAQGMSAFAGKPTDLLDWLATQDPAAAGANSFVDTFVPRRDYARYLQHCCAPLLARAGQRLVRIRDEVVDIVAQADGREQIVCANTPPVWVDKVALCLGHFAPRSPSVAGLELLQPPQYIADPWDTQAIARIDKHATVSTLGAGLSMVDVLLQLREQGFAGKVTAMSRHGLWPRAHVPQSSSIRIPEPSDAATAQSVLHSLRQQIADHARHGGDWRQVIDAMRPHTAALWRRLGPREQARILRHAKSLWDVHRHRVAPQVGQMMAKMRHAGLLTHRAGRLRSVALNPVNDGQAHPLRLGWRLRHEGDIWQQQADVLINCTGAHNDWQRASSALPQALLAGGRVVPGAHRLGLSMTVAGALYGADGQPSTTLWSMGPTRLGLDFESVAVPELRIQAEALAAVLCR